MDPAVTNTANNALAESASITGLIGVGIFIGIAVLIFILYFFFFREYLRPSVEPFVFIFFIISMVMLLQQSGRRLDTYLKAKEEIKIESITTKKLDDGNTSLVITIDKIVYCNILYKKPGDNQFLVILPKDPLIKRKLFEITIPQDFIYGTEYFVMINGKRYPTDGKPYIFK